VKYPQGVVVGRARKAAAAIMLGCAAELTAGSAAEQ
jgi:hypothetical protein